MKDSSRGFSRTLAIITLSPIDSVRFLKDPEATSEASTLSCSSYLASLENTHRPVFQAPNYHEVDIKGLVGADVPLIDANRNNGTLSEHWMCQSSTLIRTRQRDCAQSSHQMFSYLSHHSQPSGTPPNSLNGLEEKGTISILRPPPCCQFSKVSLPPHQMGLPDGSNSSYR